MEERKIAFFVDDEADFLELLQKRIQHPSFEIQTYHAVNAYRIIDEVIKLKPDVLFIDFNLPRANGAQVVSILKSVPSLAELPVYFITGYSYSKEKILPFLKEVKHQGVLLKDVSLKKEILRILDQFAETLQLNSP